MLDNELASAIERAVELAFSKRDVTPNTESVVTTLPTDDVQQVRESVAFDEAVTVKESKATTIPVKIIQPGWGSMAYYSKEVIQKTGPSVFTKGTQMFWNHATEAQAQDRPEGDLNDLAAVLTEDAQWMESGPKGPGLYAKAKVFSDYAQQVNEKGAHIGVSINAGLRAHEGEAEGRRGRIADAFVRTPLNSVDFVSKAGAGGAPIVSESQRGAQELPIMADDTKTAEALQAELATLKTQNAEMSARLLAQESARMATEAFTTVAEQLREAEIPFRESVLRRACANPTVKDGKVEEAWLKSVVDDFSGGETGKVVGMGDGTKPAKEKVDSKASAERLKEALKDLGVPTAGLDRAVATR